METVVSYVCSIVLGFVIVFGVLGSIVSVLIWSVGKRCRKMSCGNYFKLIAVADIFSLIVSGIPMLLEISPANIRLYDYNNFLCKFLPFSYHFGVQLSTWLTVCLTIERTLSIYFPLQCYYERSKRRALCLFGVICVGAIVLDFVPLLYYEITTPKVDYIRNESNHNVTSTQLRCLGPERGRFPRFLTRYISFGCFIVILPPLVILISNTLSLVKVRQQRYSADAETTFSDHSSNSTMFSYTILIILIGVLNTVSTLPIGIVYIQDDYFDTRSSLILFRVAALLFFLNSFANLTLYCLIGKAFRKDLKFLLNSNWKLRS